MQAGQVVDDWEREHGGVREAKREVREAGDKGGVCKHAIQAVRAEIIVLFPRLTVFHLPSSSNHRLLTSQADRSEVKRDPSNMEYMVSPLEVFHMRRSDWNDVA